jgi:hypothetical protein
LADSISFEELRRRAYELADTGRYEDCLHVGAALERQGNEAAIRRLLADPILRSMLDARCRQARDKND